MPTDIYARLRELTASADSKPAEMRPVLLRVITDLFALHGLHTIEELRLYEEMAGKLIAGAGDSVLTHVARKLSRCLDAPPAVLERIRARGGEPARELLLKSPLIERRDLREIAAAGACDQACAVAGRDDLDRETARILAARPEREILRALAANQGAPLGPQDTRLLAARGRFDPELARALLGRGEPTIDELPLYLFADAPARAALVLLALEANLIHAGRPEPGAPLEPEAQERIEAAAFDGKRAAFTKILAERLRCDQILARRIVDDEEGDALALAFVAIGMAKEAAARILLGAFPRIAASPEAFDHVMRLVRTVPRRVALRMIEAMAGPSAAHAPGAPRAPLPRPAPATDGSRNVSEPTPEQAVNKSRA
jgi:uncharacterized protein (DUF2336 family)